MKTVLKLVIALALLNAMVRGADAAWNYYQLKDAAQRALLFGSSSTSSQLHAQIMSSAMELQVPLNAEDLTVRTVGGRRIVSASYTKPVEFFPNYPYPLELSFAVESPASAGAPPDDDAPAPRR